MTVELASVTGLRGDLLKIRVTAIAAPGEERGGPTTLTNLAGSIRDALAGSRTLRT